MIKRLIPGMLAALMLLPAVETPVQAANKAAKAAKAEASKLAGLPPAVQTAIRNQVGTGKLDNIEKVVEDGETTYEVEMSKDGKTRAFTVNSKGELTDLEVFLAETPAPVQKTIQAQLGRNKLESITKVMEDGDVTFEVEMTEGSRTRDFTVGDDGELLDRQVFLPEIPAAVQKTIQAQGSGGQLGDITQVMEDGEITYEVEFSKAGKPHDFTVDAKGGLLDMLVYLEETPEAVQKAIKAEAGAAKLGDITKVFEDGETTFEAEIIKGNKTRTVGFDPAGKLQYQEEDVELAETPDAVKKAIAGLLTGAKLAGITKSTDDGEVTYDVDLKKEGKTTTVTLGVDGKTISDK